MPPAKKPASAQSRSGVAFKEPAALKRLNRSLDAAQEALAELRKDTGRDVGQGARDLYKDVRTFVSSARRDSGKLARALRRDFEQHALVPRAANAGLNPHPSAGRPRPAERSPASRDPRLRR